jgi:protein tyrosine phosphatase
MSINDTEINYLIDPEIKDRLKDEIQATDDELVSLEKLLKIQKEKMNNERGSRRQPSIVIDNFLYHGDLGHAIDLDLLLELRIQNIINVCDCPLDEDIVKLFKILWINDLEDNVQGNIRKCFEQTNQFLSECKEKNEKVLVHCQAGISRSSSIVLAYLIKSDELIFLFK